MSETTASFILMGLGGYSLVGICVAVFFVFGGAGMIDPAAKGRGMRLHTRFLIMPGVIGLWPLMLYKLIKQRTPPIS